MKRFASSLSLANTSSSKSQQTLSGIRPRRDDGGAPTPRPSTATGSSAHLADAVKQSHTNVQMIRQRSFLGPKEPKTVSTTDLEADDIVIAVMGPIGSGKSTFVCAASGHDTGSICHTLRSHTNQVTAVKFWDQVSRRHVVLVDTPGFGDTFKPDLDVQSMISEWLVSSYKKKLLSGILYLHRITDNRVAGLSLKNLRVFRQLCGRDALDKVYLTTTMWDEVELSVGERRFEELRTLYWKTMITQGAQVARCRSDDDSMRKLVQQIILSESSSRVDVPYGKTPPPQPPPAEHNQGLSSQEGYIVARRETPIPQPPDENRYGPSSVVQKKPQKNDTGIPTPQPPPVENGEGSSSHSHGKPQTYNVADRGSPIPQLPVENRQRPSSQSQQVEMQTHTGRGSSPAALRRALRVTKEPEIVDIDDMDADDIVVVVMGPTGSGKSTFICAASGHDTSTIGHGLKSFTSQVSAVKFWDQESGRYVVLVDTPGFNGTSKSDFDILRVISDWLVLSYKNQIRLSGILYLHPITSIRMLGTALKNLSVFRKLCGKDALNNVYLTTTMWDEVEPSVGERKAEELRMGYWGTMIAQGSQIARCRCDDDSAKLLIHQIVAREAPRKVLLIQKEMVDMRKKLKRTAAGRQLTKRGRRVWMPRFRKSSK